MATKPSNLPRWGETGGGSAGPNLTEPSSGTKDVGFVTGSPTVANYVNWLLNVVYHWVQYLSDGALSGNHSIDGDLEVTGALELGADVTIDGTLDVGGATVLDGGLTVIGATNLSASPFFGGDDSLNIHGSAFSAQNPATDAVEVTANGIVSTSGTANVYTAIPIPAGRRITSISASITTSAVAGTRTLHLFRKEFGFLGGTSSTVDSANTTAASTPTVIQITDDHVLDTAFFSIRVGLQQDDELQGVAISYDYPP